MPQEAYVPTDVKITVEKPVRPKPSLAELTKVESPGRPSPADMLESPEEKKKRKSPARKKPKSSNVEIGEPEKDSILIITEKPQAAQKIASALGSPRKYTEDGVSYFELERNGKKILVASAVGHLFGLTYVKGQKGWPIFQVEWVPSYDQKKAAFTKKYYNQIKRLAQRAKEIVIATDFDTEGEVIGWNVLRFICKQKSHEISCIIII
jgi:reverse gyrase